LERAADSDPLEPLVAIAAGAMHSLYLTESGRVLASPPKMHEDDNYGQCDVPTEATAGVASIAAGASCSAALTRSGNLIIWGAIPQAWLGEDQSQRFLAVAACSWDVAAVRDDGVIRGWGDSESFWRWPEFASGVKPPTRRGSGTTRKLALEDGHVVGLTDDGEVWSFGKPWWAQPENVPEEAKEGVTDIATSMKYSLALREDGSIILWGMAPSPVHVTRYDVPPYLDGGISHIDSGSLDTILVDAAGRVHICRLPATKAVGLATANDPTTLTVTHTIVEI
jgi:alpha-tubulin suppressor-like RCC1 family protein